MCGSRRKTTQNYLTALQLLNAIGKTRLRKPEFEIRSYTTSKLILEHGGQIAMAKFAVPGKCWQGYFVDLDNNTFGIFEVNEKAR
jgi:hypothetical protein